MASLSKISNHFIDESIAFNAPEGFAVRDATLDDVEDITRLWYMTFWESHDFWKVVTPDTPAGRAWVKEFWAISIRASPERHRIFVVEDLAKDKKLVAFLRFMVPITDGTQFHNPIPEYPPEWDAEWLNGVWGGIGNKRKEIMGNQIHWLGEFIGTDPAYKRQRLAFMLEDWFCQQQDAFGIQGYHVATIAGRLFHQSLGYKDIGVLRAPSHPDFGVYEFLVQLRQPGAERRAASHKVSQVKSNTPVNSTTETHPPATVAAAAQA
ncbi:hypothetical protein AA313_de0200580 [Arthrobotrys entomopaga]|nr:hypothetical protein AA313_de0200580 [Arthrobotrys entomopaga]